MLCRNGIVFIKTFFEGENLKDQQPYAMQELVDFYGYTTFNDDSFRENVCNAGFYIEESSKFPQMNLDFDKTTNFEKPIREEKLLVEGMDYGWENFNMNYIKFIYQILHEKLVWK